MTGDTIPVFFCTDNNFAVPTYIALYSLLYNYRGQAKIDVYIMTSQGFSEHNISLIESLGQKYNFVTIRFLDMSDSYDSVSINSGHVSRATLYRLMIPRIVDQLPDLKIDKCLYLDSDIIVDGNISELYDIDVDGYLACGVRDRALSSTKMGKMRSVVELKRLLCVPSLENYINAGVLTLNLKAIKQKGIAPALEETGFRNDFPYNDQDVINKVFFNEIKVIPLRFNAQASALYHSGKDFVDQYGMLNIREARKNPIVIHYILRRKPWACKTSMMAGKWWKYVKLQDRKVVNEYIKPFVKAHRAPLGDRVRETAKTVAIKLRIYNSLRSGYYWAKGVR